jgi:hypothetical protein
MHRTPSTRICAGLLLLGAASCRAPAPAPASPDGPPDLTGQVVEARIVRTLGSANVTIGRLGGTSGAEYIQRLRVRVIGSRSSTPVTDAVDPPLGVSGMARRVVVDSVATAGAGK